ncbi:MAG: c-type cytochrome [Steroidobacterales bacterium]
MLLNLSKAVGIAVLASASLTSAVLAAAFPDWAFPGCPATGKPAAPDSVQALSVPGSKEHFTAADIRNWTVAPDWFPREHSALPPAVATSHSPDKASCSFCHLPDGEGRPENAKLAGLPAPYITAQLRALQAGDRHPAKPDWGPSANMVRVSADLSADEIAAAAAYFSGQTAKSLVRIVERAGAPAHQPGCFIFTPGPGSATTIGSTIVEMPADPERFEHRDPHTTYVAYVPVGSVARGRKLAQSGDGGRTPPCETCHGPGLRGGSPDHHEHGGHAHALPGPPLAGRFPGYLFRQLYGFQSGARGGEAAQAMKGVVARLTQADMIDLAAYAASLKP